MTWLNIFRSKEARAPQIPFATPMLTVTTRPGEDGYIVAECPELPGCMSQGRDEREALENIVDAIQSCLAVHLIQFLNKAGHPSGRVGERFKVKPPELELIDA